MNAMWMFHVMVSASKNLHNKMFEAIVRCPVAFFDTNPVGESLAINSAREVSRSMCLCVYTCAFACMCRTKEVGRATSLLVGCDNKKLLATIIYWLQAGA